MSRHTFSQVNVFSSQPLGGNPLAVVHAADGLSDAEMAAFARWTNLSETTFLLQPTDPGADYRVRIFTPLEELPFAGHPTLGSCHAWLDAGGLPRHSVIRQQCAAGIVAIRRDGDALSFEAPPLKRSGPVDPEILQRALAGLALQPDAVLAAEWVDNGPGWMAMLLSDRDLVLAVKPDFSLIKGMRIGIAAQCDRHGEAAGIDLEVRAFTASGSEDPVTGSLNAGLARWLIGAGRISPDYTAAQGTAIGRSGRVTVRSQDDTLWIGGNVVPVIAGTVDL